MNSNEKIESQLVFAKLHLPELMVALEYEQMILRHASTLKNNIERFSFLNEEVKNELSDKEDDQLIDSLRSYIANSSDIVEGLRKGALLLDEAFRCLDPWIGGQSNDIQKTESVAEFSSSNDGSVDMKDELKEYARQLIVKNNFENIFTVGTAGKHAFFRLHNSVKDKFRDNLKVLVGSDNPSSQIMHKDFTGSMNSPKLSSFEFYKKHVEARFKDFERKIDPLINDITK